MEFIKKNRVSFSFAVFITLIARDVILGIRPYDPLAFSDTSATLSLLAVIVGVFLRSWAAGVVRKSETLACTGPYAFTRHPLYLGSFLVAVGMGYLTGDVVNLFAVGAVAVIFYHPTIRSEERFLAGKFGKEWEEYCARVWAFFPRSAPRNVLAQWTFAQWLRNKEYKLASAAALGILAMSYFSY
ncbi:MAG: isoprenylcysteine carboxylmethyltransferase family protein [Elusimicrobiota bacterium]